MTPLEVLILRALRQETKLGLLKLYIKKATKQLSPLMQLRPQRAIQQLTPPKEETQL